MAKNILRPRTGSNKTQDRAESGGVIITDPDIIRQLFTIENRGKHFILYRKIDSKEHDAVLAHDNEIHQLKGVYI